MTRFSLDEFGLDTAYYQSRRISSQEFGEVSGGMADCGSSGDESDGFNSAMAALSGDTRSLDALEIVRATEARDAQKELEYAQWGRQARVPSPHTGPIYTRDTRRLGRPAPSSTKRS